LLQSGSCSTRPRARVHRVLSALVAAAVSAVSITDTARAQTLYWDVNGASDGATNGTTASGTWSISNPNWTFDATGNSSTFPFSNFSPAVFSAGNNATGAST